jgi:hypothetical protein
VIGFKKDVCTRIILIDEGHGPLLTGSEGGESHPFPPSVEERMLLAYGRAILCLDQVNLLDGIIDVTVCVGWYLKPRTDLVNLKANLPKHAEVTTLMALHNEITKEIEGKIPRYATYPHLHITAVAIRAYTDNARSISFHKGEASV